jgi:hypothetical protein
MIYKYEQTKNVSYINPVYAVLMTIEVKVHYLFQFLKNVLISMCLWIYVNSDLCTYYTKISLHICI